MSSTGRFALVGGGIGHSLSPRLFATACAVGGVAGTYTLLEAPDAASARDAFAALRRGEWQGLNVTTPHKALALASADGWQRSAPGAAGALTVPANVLWSEGDRLIAASTDGPGLLDALTLARARIDGQHVLLLGAGGAAVAVAPALLAAGVRLLTVTNRTKAAATALAQRLSPLFPGRVAVQPWGATRDLGAVDCVVHATRLGHGAAATPEAEAALAAALDWLPWRAWRERPPLLLDLVYANPLTALQALAVARGLPLDLRLAATGATAPSPRGVLGHFGEAMLAHQAARAFALWTHVAVDPQAMLRAILAPQLPAVHQRP